jgi:hypothetical protein
MMNYKPICETPRTGCISNAAGYTMCVGCKSDEKLGPAWHPTNDMKKAEVEASYPSSIEGEDGQTVRCTFCKELYRSGDPLHRH